jgi:hypothetical protein
VNAGIRLPLTSVNAALGLSRQKTPCSSKVPDMTFTYFPASPSYYQGIAHELEAIADAVADQPHLNRQFSERLRELSQQMRADLLTVSHSKLH